MKYIKHIFESNVPDNIKEDLENICYELGEIFIDNTILAYNFIWDRKYFYPEEQGPRLLSSLFIVNESGYSFLLDTIDDVLERIKSFLTIHNYSYNIIKNNESTRYFNGRRFNPTVDSIEIEFWLDSDKTW